ncbi:MAG: DUF1385 domain-containing protein [Bacillota bacterium]|nr:DUF1385 domain-containing protein [Bacillota bacterium]
MRGPASWAVAVRLPDRSVAVERRPVETVTRRFPFLKWPFLRGTVVLIESMVIGLQALSYSAAQATGEEERPLTPWEIGGTMVVALALAVALFVLLPVGVAHLALPYVRGTVGTNILEGVVRVLVFLAYVYLIGLMPDIRRVFAYHGAEHKTINALEAGAPLEVRHVQRFSTRHPRCGTSFLLIVLVVSIAVFSFLATEPLWWRFVSRLLMLPVVAGISYEFVKAGACRLQSPLWRVLVAPGLWLQALTTREPDDGMVEVAIASLDAVMEREEGER